MAVKYKCAWNAVTILLIVLPAVATLISVFITPEYEERSFGIPIYVIPIVTFLTTVTSGLSAAFKVADKKASYRNLAENIKGELALYHGKAGLYQKKREAERLNILYQNIEKIIQDGYNKISSLDDDKAKNGQGTDGGNKGGGSSDDENDDVLDLDE